ncbi:MAG: hemolysin III family protein [Oscillospiraceae bacterium]|jgi:hemolysin III|nr:hemolysin III family protein [Oscillospiraceae bacterium]
MKPMKPKKPHKKEERTPTDALRLYSALTHGIGAWLASIAVAVLIFWAAMTGSAWQVVSFSVYGFTLIALYTASTLYHSLRLRPSRRLTLRKLDHVMIYMLIAGTYTPICLVSLREQKAWGWAIFGVIWGVALIGAVVKLCVKNPPRGISTATYLLMGWLVIVVIIPLVKVMTTTSLVLLGAGGLCYTVGAILYALKWPKKDSKYFGFHEVFHIFVLLGSVCHYIMMFFL